MNPGNLPGPPPLPPGGLVSRCCRIYVGNLCLKRIPFKILGMRTPLSGAIFGNSHIRALIRKPLVSHTPDFTVLCRSYLLSPGMSPDPLRNLFDRKPETSQPDPPLPPGFPKSRNQSKKINHIALRLGDCFRLPADPDSFKSSFCPQVR